MAPPPPDFPPWVTYLAEAGRLAPSADNSQPWRFVFDGRTLRVEFDPERGGGLGREHPAVLLAFGCLIENLVQAAHHAGIPTDNWRFCDFVASGRLLAIPEPATPPLTPELPEAIRARHTNRHPFATTPLPEALLTALETRAEDGIQVRCFTQRGDIRRLAALVRRASQLRFQTEEIHRWLAASLRFTPAEVARGDGLDVETLALPPGGRALSRFLADWRRQAFFNRFGLHRLLARIEAAQLRRCGALIAILAKKDPAAADWLAAGRLMERVWLALTEAGIAVQPYFVLPDQLERLRRGRIPPRLRPQAQAQALAGETGTLFADRTPLMLLRAGGSGKTVVRARRLPREAILHVEYE